jgi:hypothetical protein
VRALGPLGEREATTAFDWCVDHGGVGGLGGELGEQLHQARLRHVVLDQ